MRDHLVDVTARLLHEHTPGDEALTVRRIASTAGVAVGALYNHFDDRDELFARALARAVEQQIATQAALPVPGQGSVEDNLVALLHGGVQMLRSVATAFVHFIGRPQIISHAGHFIGDGGPPPLHRIFGDYLQAEQALGRIRADADLETACSILGAVCHEHVLPQLLFHAGELPAEVPEETLRRAARVVLDGIGRAEPS